MLLYKKNQKALWKVVFTFFLFVCLLGFFNGIMLLLIFKPAMINQSKRGEDLEVRADFSIPWNLSSIPEKQCAKQSAEHS